MPDRRRGYVKRGKGILPRDFDMGARYRGNINERAACFEDDAQRIMIDKLHAASAYQRYRVHSVGTDYGHFHGLVSWRDTRHWSALRRSIRTSLTRRLNRDIARRTWFVNGSSRKRVKDRDHFDHLVETYLPDHPGWKWSPEKGLYK